MYSTAIDHCYYNNRWSYLIVKRHPYLIGPVRAALNIYQMVEVEMDFMEIPLTERRAEGLRDTAHGSKCIFLDGFHRDHEICSTSNHLYREFERDLYADHNKVTVSVAPALSSLAWGRDYYHGPATITFENSEQSESCHCNMNQDQSTSRYLSTAPNKLRLGRIQSHEMSPGDTQKPFAFGGYVPYDFDAENERQFIPLCESPTIHEVAKHLRSQRMNPDGFQFAISLEDLADIQNEAKTLTGLAKDDAKAIDVWARIKYQEVASGMKVSSGLGKLPFVPPTPTATLTPTPSPLPGKLLDPYPWDNMDSDATISEAEDMSQVPKHSATSSTYMKIGDVFENDTGDEQMATPTRLKTKHRETFNPQSGMTREKAKRRGKVQAKMNVKSERKGSSKKPSKKEP